MSLARRERGLVRPHVVTGGRARPSRSTLCLVTLVKTLRADTRGLSPEARRAVELCGGGALSVAEVAAHLRQPVSVAKVVLADLVDSGHLLAVDPLPLTDVPSMELLQEVLDGLKALR